MEAVHIQSLPGHGLAWIAVPAGSGLTGARLASGGPLDAQFLPAPFACDIDGFLLISASAAPLDVLLTEGTPCAQDCAPTALSIGAGGLSLTLDGRTYLLDDAIENIEGPGMPNQELAYDALNNKGGLFRLFGAQTRVFTVSDGPVARVERALTSPVGEDGGALGDVAACYDFVIYKGVRLVQVIASFSGDAPERASFYRFLNVRLPRSYARWEGGLEHMEGEVTEEPGGPEDKGRLAFQPRSFDHYGALRSEGDAVAIVGAQVRIGEADGCLTLTGDSDRLNRDITEYGPSHPFSAYLLWGKDAQPRAWLGRLPAFYRAEAPNDGHETNISLRAGDLLARFSSDGHGAQLVEMRDCARGCALLSGGGNTLFTVMVREIQTGRQIGLNSLSGWKRVSLLKSEAARGGLTMVFDEAEKAPGISVLLTARCDASCPDNNRITWEMDVRNASDALTLLQADYPRLAYDAAGRTCAFVAAGSGEVYEDIRDVGLHLFMQYSSAWAAMQYICCWYENTGRGLYFGIHDPTPTKKDLISDKQSLTGRGQMIALVPMQGIGEPRNGQMMPGQAVWQLFDGDWYDAAQIYRRWVLPHAQWVPAMTDEGRPDVPRWLRKAPMWFNVSVGAYGGGDTDADWATRLIEAARDLGVPAAAHVYNWHEIPFDNDYPHYFPAKQAFIDAVPALKAAGVRLMPYINTRLWDTHDRGAEDYQFTTVAKPAATKNVLGNVITEHYGSTEKDGSPVRLGVMCPTTALWQETQREICRRLFEEVGVDGVYLDQIAAQMQPLCFDKAHSHRPGGGSWWAEGYANLMEHLQRVKPEEGVYTTECNAEIFMNRLDAYLTWHWARAGQVPAFSAVYAGYVPMFGRLYNDDRVKFRILASQSLLFGDQMGWIGPGAYLNAPDRALFKKCVEARWRFADYFYAGRMLGPPEVDCALSGLSTLKAFASTRAIHSPAVRCALWQRLKDGARMFLLVNIADEAADADVAIDAPDCEASLSGDGQGTVRIKDGMLRLRLAPLSVTAGELPV